MNDLAPPPSAIEIEKELVGIAILEPDNVLPEALKSLDMESFMHPACRAAWFHMVRLYETGKPITLATITAEIHAAGDLEKVGGAMELSELLDSAAPAHTITPHHCERLVAMRQRRQLLRVAAQLEARARDLGTDPHAVMQETQGGLIDIIGHGSRSARPMREISFDVIRDLEQAYKSRGRVTRGIATGFADLDRQLMGVRPKYFYVIGARPSMGKSTLLVNMAENMALAGHSVLLFTLEMPDLDIGTRMIVGGASVDLQKSRSGQFAAADLSRIRARANSLASAPMYVDDTPGLSIADIRARARVHHQRHGVKAVFVDYLQLIKGTSKRAEQSRYLEIGEVCKGLKQLAMELDIAVLTAAQLGRQADERRDHRPMLSDLRESGDIEQDADVIALLRRPGYYREKEAAKGKGKKGDDLNGWAGDDEDAEPDNIAYLDIAKHRNGPVGECKLVFESHFTRFRDPEGTKLYG
jgi:replicative DNA helicase